MSLDLPQLLQPVDDLSAYAARRAEAAAAAIPAAQQSLQAAAKVDPETLNRKIAAAGPGWRGARPTDEPMDAAFAPPPHPAQLHVLGADGSQIYTDRHAAAFFYLVNIGSLHLVHGSGEPPRGRRSTSMRKTFRPRPAARSTRPWSTRSATSRSCWNCLCWRSPCRVRRGWHCSTTA